MSSENIATIIINEHLAEGKDKPIDIYQRMKMPKNSFFRLYKDTEREPSISTLVKLRKGVKWRKERFWKRVISAYDTKTKA
jgi:hypothetical protein